MSRRWSRIRKGVLTAVGVALTATVAGKVLAQEGGAKKVGGPPAPRGVTSFTPVAQEEDFNKVVGRMKAAKPEVMKRQMTLLGERYDLANQSRKDATMARGKAVQMGVRVKLPSGMTWEKLAAMTPEEIKEKGVYPKGFLPLPHPNHDEGGMVFPQAQIKEVLKQTGRDLTRFDLDYDIPEQFLPEFPPPIYLTTRPDLGDVSKGQLVTTHNFYELFNGILNPKQLDGLRLLVSPFAQQQFNMTPDRRSLQPSLGVACLDCHTNGHTNAATHEVGDIRPQAFRHRIDTPTLRGVNVQRLFGSQRALRTVEDFTEFEQRAAYFDGDPVIAMKKGVHFLDRGEEVHAMAEFQELLDFPPAPKLNVYGKLDPKKATEAELRGQDIFNGKGTCVTCHPAPYYTDNTMHNLQTERFFKPQMVNGRWAAMDGPIKTFPLRGIKDSPPYLHDDRLLTLDDSVEFFNLVLGTNLNEQEKKDLVAFLLTL
jgi:cytochrome c peroxidase